MNNHSNQGSFGSSDWLMGAVKKNPEGLLLLAAGCALLMRSGSSWTGSAASNSGSGRAFSDHQPGSRGGRNSDWGVADGISRAADTAGEYASNLTRSMTETATGYASTAADFADRAKRTIAEGSGRIADQAQSTMQNTVDRVLREQPLAVALAGLAAGALVAAAFPATSIERQTLGHAGERLSEAATKTGQQLQEAASAAGDRLMEVAEERGLTASGLKEMASDVAGSFGSAFSGEKQEKSASVSSGSSSSSSGSQSNRSGSQSSTGYSGQGSSRSTGSQTSSPGSTPHGTSPSGGSNYGSSGNT